MTRLKVYGLAGFPMHSLQSLLYPIMFNIFVNVLDKSIDGMFINYTNNTKLGGIANTVDNF